MNSIHRAKDQAIYGRLQHSTYCAFAGQKFTGRGTSRFLADPGQMAAQGERIGEARWCRSVGQVHGQFRSGLYAAGSRNRRRTVGMLDLARACRRVVRRLQGPVTLNGGQFEEAAAKNGDRLRIGGVELEVVDCSQPFQQPAPRCFQPPPPNVDTTELEAKLAEAMATIRRLEGESRQGFQSSIVAADRADQLRSAAAAHAQLEDTCRDLTAAQKQSLFKAARLKRETRNRDGQRRGRQAG